MQSQMPERLVPLLIFAAIMAYNALVPWLRRWLAARREAAARGSRTTPAAEQAARVAAAAAAAAAVAARDATRRSSRAPALPVEARAARAFRAQAEPAPAVHALQRRPVRELIAGRSRLRDAVVVSTVLGPCRALQPHETQD